VGLGRDFFTILGEAKSTKCSKFSIGKGCFYGRLWYLIKEAKNEERLQRLNEQIESMEQKMSELSEKDARLKDSLSEETDTPDENERILLQYPEEARYIVHQALLQSPTFKNLEDSLARLGSQVREITRPGQYAFDHPAPYLKSLYEASIEQGFALTDTVWEKIDKLEDLVLLRQFCVLTNLKIRELTLWKWRLYAFEKSDYWTFFRGD
jgi:SMC interacting uncharacterized protein involved in chromosome segregation